jgi:hypothetical protein
MTISHGPPEGAKKPTSAQNPKDQKTPPALPDDVWRSWYPELRAAVDDLQAVTADQTRRKQRRDLGPRQAKRLYRDARDKLASLFAYADRGRNDD